MVAFDKTGTLTHGEPVVTDIMPFEGSEPDLLEKAAALEHYSEHPLAQAIAAHAWVKGIEAVPADAFEALAGAGAKARIAGETWYIGSPALFEEIGAVSRTATERIAALQEQGKTIVLVGSQEGARGLIALRDRVRHDAKETITRLHGHGLRTIMLTGDNARAARAVASELGIDDVRSDLKPPDKVAAVKEIEGRYGQVLMIGDGVNDAPALAAATCGVAMGTAGSDAAIEAADIALMADELAKVEEALQLGRVARRISLQNIVFSLLVLAVMIPLAVLGVIGVALTVLVHEASELLAVINGLRVGRYRRAEPATRG